MTSTATDQITGFSGSLAVKQPVRLATLVDIVLEGLIAIDGIVPAEGDRVLVKAQATPSQNGIYIASTGVWSRAADFDATGKAVKGTQVWVTDGTTQAGTLWIVSAANPIVIDTSALTWQAGNAYQAGAAMAAAIIAATSKPTPVAADRIGYVNSVDNSFVQMTWAQMMAALLPGSQGDPGVGVPTGGTTGQVLKKASEADYDTEWGSGGVVVLNVKDFGATGGGDDTPDREAIQAAIDAAAALPTGGTVHFPDGHGEIYAIEEPLIWKPKVSFHLGSRAVVRATAAMDAVLQSGVGSEALSTVFLVGGRWDCNYLAKRAIHIKQGARVLMSDFAMEKCGAYVDGTSETTSAYIQIGDAAQTSTSYEINISNFLMYRTLDGGSPTPAPANNYGIYSHSASDSQIAHGGINGVKKGVYGALAHWKISTVHVWNYTPEQGHLINGFHSANFGGVHFMGNQVDCGTGVVAFLIDGASPNHPSSVFGNQVHCTEGTDNTGYAFGTGSGSVVTFVGNTITCDVSHRYASSFGGTTTDTTRVGNRVVNVVNGTSDRVRSLTVFDQGGTQTETRLVSGSYTSYLVQFASGAFNLSTNGGLGFLSGSSFVLGLYQDLLGRVVLNKGYALGTQYVAPATGASVTINDDTSMLVINPAATIAALTVVMPASPVDGQVVRISSSQIVTTLTLNANAGQTMKNGVTSLTAGQSFGRIYRAADATWYAGP